MHKTIYHIYPVLVTQSFAFVYIPVSVDLLSLGYMLSVIRVYKTRRVVFPLALVRAASAVPGHSGTPAIEAELRRREGGVQGT